ncbi:MAG: ATP-binding cassette domain-containing protein [Bdellovibrionales bacterium]|nr:ATP-binding cassette domain-containing protein [Bdellovibrionales bacterium]
MLYLENLKKIYNNNKVKAVDIKELRVEKAGIVCLVGPSGCGKTTTLKMINRLIEPSEGIIEINGVRSDQTHPVSWRRKIGYVIQKIGLFPHLTVMQNISLLSRVLKRDRVFIEKRVHELLELVGLNPEQYKKRYPKELSGGQRQRVGIARALMEDPPLLLMDEPFGALDSITASSLREEFKNLNQTLKKTIIMVTHNLSEAFEMGDEVVLMQRGSIVQQGSWEDFKNSPANSFVKEFFNAKL